MRRQVAFFVVLLIMLCIIELYQKTPKLQVMIYHNHSKSREINPNQTTQAPHNNADSTGQIKRESYQKDGIEAYYPFITEGGTKEQQSAWNQIIKEDFDKILQIYSFRPFPTGVGNSTSVVPTILKIDYVIERNDSDFISVLYKATYQSPYVAHPTELVYTTNIDKKRNVRLRLMDIVTINREFVHGILKWKLVMDHQNEKMNLETDQLKSEMQKAVKDYVKNISLEDFILGLSTADQISSQNLYGNYSYLTPDRLGISISVPNYIGDHVELEQDLTELTPYLKLE